MDKRIKYYTNSEDEFIIENYNNAGSFSNFLPGIAGLFGIPLWVFYVNRGQCICSFGLKTKDNAIMEFLSANRAYQLASLQGFRTFFKINGPREIFYEPFKAQVADDNIIQRMHISSYELKLQDINKHLGIETEVTYFTIPNQPFGGLARIVRIKNLSKRNISLEILDGAPLIIPFGVSNFFLQKMRRTVEAWMLVENLDKHAPFYRLKVDPKDISEVIFIKEGNFYTTVCPSVSKSSIFLPIIIDPEVIFGEFNDFTYPIKFMSRGFRVPAKQMGQNKLPCAMSHTSFELKKERDITFYTLTGHIESKERLNALLPQFKKEEFFSAKRKENKNIIKELGDCALTHSGHKKFDPYCGQTFLDNVLRGGFPLACIDHHCVFYVYSRKHGDLERDYNKFYIEPAYFSQGDGNFRDISQNRRCDIFFNPDIVDFNVLYFYNLIQPDGFNPLILKGVRFRLDNVDYLSGDNLRRLKGLLTNPHGFTPGELFMAIEKLGIKIEKNWSEFLSELLKNCTAIHNAEHGEGFWIDHWTYNLDLVETFLSIYPDKLKDVFLDKKEFIFYDNAFCVKPRSERYLLIKEGMVRQYHSLQHDAKKEYLIKKRTCKPHAVRTKNGKGDIYNTTLLVKMLCLVINKIASLDPSGTGIEMEADKPGWCDSMNGLPGLCGSSTPELFELKRQVVFILNSLEKLGLGDNYKIDLAEELYDFIKEIENLLKECLADKTGDFYYWDKSNLVKEHYREQVKFGFTGIEKSLSAGELKEILKIFLRKLDIAIKKAYIPSKKIYATYFINEVFKYESIDRLDPVKGLPLVKPLEFKTKALPLFLEGPVRAMKIEPDKNKLKEMYLALKKSKLYDRKLKMYKINEPLEGISKEVGRSSIFTPGWLENESIWLHMEYKYLLEILKSGLHEEFFEEFKNVLIPFQKPERYGRSVFENSSFIVSSAFPDKKMHGRGFVARLSGSTAEFLNIWLLMNIGPEPFFLNEKNELCLRFRPALPAWLFTKTAKNGFLKNTFAFKFLGKTLVVYHNPKMKDTAGENSVKSTSIDITYSPDKKIQLDGGIVPLPYSLDARNRTIERIDIYLA